MKGDPKLAEANDAQCGARLDVFLLLQGSVLLMGFLLVFGPTMPPLYADWRTFDTFSHGLLVPFIAAYMLWQKRAELRKTMVAPSSWGVTLLIPALLLGLLGKVIGDGFTERVGLVLCLSSLVWLLLGWQFFKRVSFPLAYLFLMIPLPYLAVKEVAYQLRIVDAALAAPALRVLGVPVYRDSYYLHLPDVILEVADLCSGISSVFALFALGAAYVYFSPLRPKWKLLAVMSTFPFAAFINLFRIVLTAALAYYVSPAVLGVLIHELTGTITFFIALLLFIGLSEFLQRRFKQSTNLVSGNSATLDDSALPVAGSADLLAKKSWRTLALAMAVLVPAVFVTFSLKAEGTVPLALDLATVPTDVAGFRATEEQNKESYRDPNADKELSRRYRASAGESVEVYIGFRGNQSGSKRLSSPKLQFPFGWNFVWIEPARLPSRGDATVNANWMLTRHGQVRVLVLYWYQVRGKTFASEMQNRLDRIRGAILERRTDGAIVRLATAISDLENIETAKSRLAAIAGDLYPELRRVLPR